jgi:hypothetical protein
MSGKPAEVLTGTGKLEEWYYYTELFGRVLYHIDFL